MRWQFDLRAFIPSVVAPRQRWHRSVADPPLAQRERNPRCNAPTVSRLYAAKRGSRPLSGVGWGVCQSTPQCIRSRSR
jgi:hypothetical protein